MSYKEKREKAVLSEEEVQNYLDNELPKWKISGKWISRKYKTGGWKSTLMVINTVGHLSESAWHHPDIEASYAFVVVKLMTHGYKGITLKDIQLAKKIEEAIIWQPALDDTSELEGTPNEDPKFTYIKYD